MDAVLKIDAHGVALRIVRDHIDGAVINDKILQSEIEKFLVENGFVYKFRKGLVFNNRDFLLAIDGDGDCVSGSGNYARATVDALLLVHIH